MAFSNPIFKAEELALLETGAKAAARNQVSKVRILAVKEDAVLLQIQKKKLAQLQVSVPVAREARSATNLNIFTKLMNTDRNSLIETNKQLDCREMVA